MISVEQLQIRERLISINILDYIFHDIDDMLDCKVWFMTLIPFDPC